MCMPLIRVRFGVGHGSPRSAQQQCCGPCARCQQAAPPGREQAAVLVRDVVFNILDGCLVTNSLQNSHKTGLVILK